jgi:hypothetical protein
MLEAEAILDDEVLAAMREAVRRVAAPAGEILTLRYWSEFREPDGRRVDGFVPGYQIDACEGRPTGNWVRLRVRGIGFILFWPRFDVRDAGRVKLSFASRRYGTFALAGVD